MREHYSTVGIDERQIAASGVARLVLGKNGSKTGVGGSEVDVDQSAAKEA